MRRPAFPALTEHGMIVYALRNPMTKEKQRLFFMHWWGVGRSQGLAVGLRADLDKMNIQKA
ncbi:DUF1259 domain-containing protein [Microvirga sp. WGZ8]|uniref:DUF1259 domain-containing protein n=1 Tax=Microvirga puerhi TaxID=2876078 RepID=A0ABS7VLI3_9HYPH|nr:DUF1259 domain-containing protein [Microvirga puerhi]